MERDDAVDSYAQVNSGMEAERDKLSPHPQSPLPSGVAGAIGMLIAEGERLLEQLHTEEGDMLLNTMLRSSTPASRALKSRVNTPQVEDGAEDSGDTAEVLAGHDQSVDQLIVEADELAAQLPDEHIKDLLTAIERGSTPVAQAVRSRVQTPVTAIRKDSIHEDMSLSLMPLLDVDRARLECTTNSVFSLLTERTRTHLSVLGREGKLLMDQLDDDSRSGIAETLAHQFLSPSRPIASLLVSIVLQSGLDDIHTPDAVDDDEARLQDLIEDAGYILAAILESVASDEQLEQRKSMLASLQEMASQDGDNFVARMLFFDLMVSCRSISEGGHVDGSMSERSRGQFGELVEQGANLIDHLPQQDVRSVLDSITSGAAANRCLYCLTALKVYADLGSALQFELCGLG